VLFALRIMGFPQELETVGFNSEPKRHKSVSLSPKRSVFTLVGLAHGVVTEKLRFPYVPLLVVGEKTKPLSLLVSAQAGSLLVSAGLCWFSV